MTITWLRITLLLLCQESPLSRRSSGNHQSQVVNAASHALLSVQGWKFKKWELKVNFRSGKWNILVQRKHGEWGVKYGNWKCMHLSSLKSAPWPCAWSGHATHVAWHHSTVVTTAREHRTLVPEYDSNYSYFNQSDYDDMITMTMPMIMTLMMMLICSDVNGNHTCGHFPWSCHPSLSEETPCPRPISLAWCNTWSWWWWCPWCSVTLVFFHDHDWQ